MKRLDTALVELKLAPSRTKAQRMIEAGEVECFNGHSWACIKQTSHRVKEVRADQVRVASTSQILKYVSRGGLKLEGALERLKLDVKGWRALDVGISTGGFTDRLLQGGCREVIGIDVGHAQLAQSLQSDPRVQLFEGVNVRELPENLRAEIAKGIDLCVIDVSFISLLLVFLPLSEVLPRSARILALVKPQFEVGAKNLDKNGIVHDATLFLEVQTQMLRALEKCGFSTVEYFPCGVRGQDGNQEFFVYAQRA